MNLPMHEEYPIRRCVYNGADVHAYLGIEPRSLAQWPSINHLSHPFRQAILNFIAKTNIPEVTCSSSFRGGFMILKGVRHFRKIVLTEENLKINDV